MFTLLKWKTVFCVTLACFVVADVNAQWRNSLAPAGDVTGEVVLVKDGAPNGEIHLAASPTSEEKKAAEELQHWIEQISGVKLPIETKNAGPTVTIRKANELGEEGYRISVEGGNLVLEGGGGRGVVNAVYALLEEDLGCRFYTNNSVKLPQTKSLAVQPVARNFVPQLRLRDPFYKAAFDATWSLRNRTNAPSAPVGEEYGGHVDYGGYFVHTHASLLPPGTYFGEHPDYYALNAAGQRYTNQLCATEPEVARLVSAAVLKALKDHRETEIISVSKNDNPGDQICHCERCKKLRPMKGAATSLANSSSSMPLRKPSRRPIQMW